MQRRNALADVRRQSTRAGNAGDVMWDAILRARRAGCSLRDISEASGIPLASLHRQLKEET